MHHVSPDPAASTAVPADRASRILDAAELCFVRAGFHRTTMQDVAAEAGMSPGNLYRYFKSKDAMVAGLAGRDRARLGRDFSVFDGAGEFMDTFRKLGRKHFEEEPRSKAIMCLEIWAEATRNPAMAAMNAEFDRDIHGRLTGLFREAQRRGDIAETVDPSSVARVMSLLANGLFVRRAVAADFDAAREVGHVFTIVGAMLDGSVNLNHAPACVSADIDPAEAS